MASYIEKLEIEAFRSGITPRTKESLEWFRKRVQNIKNVNRRELLKDDALIERQRTVLGKMFMLFGYYYYC